MAHSRENGSELPSGYLTGITAAVAAVLAPFFLGYGLRKGAYVGTLGFNVFIIQIAKINSSDSFSEG